MHSFGDLNAEKRHFCIISQARSIQQHIDT